MKKQSTLHEIVNVPEKVKAFGRTYEIRRFPLGQFTRAMEHVAPMVILLRKLADLPKDAKGLPSLDSQAGTDLMATALAICGPSVFGLISVATEEPIEWLEEQDAIDGLAIFAKVVEKNLDFFSPANLERLTAMLGGLQQQIPTSGGESSTTSLPPDMTTV